MNRTVFTLSKHRSRAGRRSRPPPSRPVTSADDAEWNDGAAPSRRGRWPAIVGYVRIRDLQLPAAVRLSDVLATELGARVPVTVDGLLDASDGRSHGSELRDLVEATRRLRAEIIAALGEEWVRDRSIDEVRHRLDELIVHDRR